MCIVLLMTNTAARILALVGALALFLVGLIVAVWTRGALMALSLPAFQLALFLLALCVVCPMWIGAGRLVVRAVR